MRVVFFSLWGSLASATPPPALPDVAHQLAWAPEEETRLEAARHLQVLPPEQVGGALADAFRWVPDRAPAFVGNTGLVAAMDLSPEDRVPVATELMAWRVGLVLVGVPEVPPRLEAELRGVLGPQIQSLGQPTATTDWLHLFCAAGGDLAGLFARLDLEQQGRWAYVYDEDQTLTRGDLRDALPLLGHRSEIVRTRAARRFEETPSDTADALRRAWRYAPGRSAPLRGDVAVPVIPWEEGRAIRWHRQLVRWAKRTNRQHDDRALRATLWLLCEPRLTSAMPEAYREHAARALMRAARRDARSARSADLAQAMDAVLRLVPFDDGEPAPEQYDETRDTWERQHPEL